MPVQIFKILNWMTVTPNNHFFWYALLPPLKVRFSKVLALEPKRFEIVTFAVSVTPITFKFEVGSVLCYFLIRHHLGVQMVKCSKLEVLRQIKIGLHIFSNLQKIFFFATTY